MNILNKRIEEYIRRMTTAENDILEYISRQTYLSVIYPQMISGQLQGKLLEMFSCMLRPKFILEIGTFTAYSTVCLAKGLAENGKIITIEVNPELEEHILTHIRLAGISDKTNLIIGDAINIIPNLNYSFDLVFIDGDKKQYVEYFNAVLPTVKQGGFIIADNVLWGGKVLHNKKTNDKETNGIIQFNNTVLNCQQVEVIIIPIRDGISIIRKIQ